MELLAVRRIRAAELFVCRQRAVLRVTSFGTFVRGTPSSYTFGSTCETDPFDEWHRTNGERLAPMTSTPIIEAWKLIELVDVTTIDFGVSFTTLATSNSRFEMVSPARRPEIGLVSQREMSSLSTLPGCPRVRCERKSSNFSSETPSSSPCYASSSH